MPELPEVETIRRSLDRLRLPDRVVTDVAVTWPRSVGGNPAAFRDALVGRCFTASGRRGKYLLYTLEPSAVLTIHLRMSGRLYLVPRTEPATGYERVTLRLDDDRELRFYDPRKFGRLTIGPEPAPGVAHLGPEPLEDGFTPAAFADELQRRRRMIKPLLLDQGFVAGLGNIYVSEALYHARVSPRRQAANVGSARAERLAAAVKRVLAEAIESGGSSLRDYVQPTGELGYFQHRWAVYGREGERCPDCNCDVAATGGIRRIVQSNRSTFYCPLRQR